MGTAGRKQQRRHRRYGGGARRDRTADLLHAMQALSQLSYSPANERGTLRQQRSSVNTHRDTPRTMASADRKILEIRNRGMPVDGQMGDNGILRAMTTPVDERLERFPLALRLYPNRTAGLVPDPPSQPQTTSLEQGRRSETDSLNAASNHDRACKRRHDTSQICERPHDAATPDTARKIKPQHGCRFVLLSNPI